MTHPAGNGGRQPLFTNQCLSSRRMWLESICGQGPGQALVTSAGGGENVFLLESLQWDVIGVTPTLQQTQYAEEAAGVHGSRARFVCGSPEQLPFREESFHLLVHSGAEGDGDFSEKAFRVMKPRGKFRWFLPQQTPSGPILDSLKRAGFQNGRLIYMMQQHTYTAVEMTAHLLNRGQTAAAAYQESLHGQPAAEINRIFRESGLYCWQAVETEEGLRYHQRVPGAVAAAEKEWRKG
ncbi:class I SAM-dependent methyltransferase [Alkalicoccus urumqiensis]|uniref:Methyltransferase domain-containing protein n=1 Tax=Alkalicoccus urumqiensis TaxID=1548213 RepID=A0A2P6MLB6_ALKUR|nr:class I SAM-dependent methyltransferase [Alkalicoccus urumqiensis]PRO67072.1 hypothetical protein C6I21_00450 [Alkalicoccus urumqiensis]